MLPQDLLESIKNDIITVLTKAHESNPEITVPDLAYTGVDNPVVTCEAIQVYMQRIVQDTNPESCGCGLIANVIATISRDCANMADDEGVDIPHRVEEVSDEMLTDGLLLSTVAQLYLESTWAVEFTVTGGIGISSLTMDLPIPC